MKVIYDRATDILSLLLNDGPVVESDELREGVIVDYGQGNKIVSVEILDASDRVTEPESLTFELK